MKRSGPIKRRSEPRRKVRSVEYKRIKPKAGASPNAEERQHLAYVATLPCLVCGVKPVTVHHVTASVHGGRISRSHKRVVPLCPKHHLIQFGSRESVEALGHGGFLRAYGIDLEAEATRIWSDRQNALYGPVIKP